ncbi:predicted protein [Sclerotinia sclerotiorum 1980 UF-70]|uniref:Uncharacterized protein n=1 Tax=Sclerotinia sclerotiorum (strain ATCC 18683 / 1980 / Ss-1) TaxID=665079 RepID=A7F0F9_SCLS1|nr:predicted protein [Sclerotinia sclerotiorum 1980 UF-70]EDN95201.1 predicted protein [Sclerotinia sclerotiorum 1980 UF-70]
MSFFGGKCNSGPIFSANLRPKTLSLVAKRSRSKSISKSKSASASKAQSPRPKPQTSRLIGQML